MTLVVREFEDGDQPAWDAFVGNCNAASFFHLSGWKKVLEQSFGHSTHFLLAERDGRIEGVLPLAHIKSRIFGSSLSSLPFCVYGGVASVTPEADSLLRESGAGLAQELNVDALELRCDRPSGSGWPVKDLYYTFRKDIDADNDVNMKSIPNRQRAMVRKGIKEGLVSEETADISRLYRVYSESVRNLGTPVFGRRYLDVLQQQFGDACRILMIRQGEQDVAGVMSFYFRNEVLPYYGGSIARAREIRGCNHFMYWELMRRSAEEGIERYDFGRSKAETGPFSFKKHFGFEPEPLPYEYFLVNSRQIPDVNPLNPKYRMMVNTWKRLPLPLANTLGPWIARNLG